MARRARTPRTSSWPTEPATKAANANMHSASGFWATWTGSRATAHSAAHALGKRKLRRVLAAVARRQAITGPIPLSRTSIRASGTV